MFCGWVGAYSHVRVLNVVVGRRGGGGSDMQSVGDSRPIKNWSSSCKAAARFLTFPIAHTTPTTHSSIYAHHRYPPLAQLFQKYLANKGKEGAGPDFTAQVLTSGSWPLNTLKSTFILPREVCVLAPRHGDRVPRLM